MVPHARVAAPLPVPLSPTEAHYIQLQGHSPDDWMALIVQVPAEGLAMGSPPAAEDIVIIQTTAVIPTAVVATQRRLVALPENVPPVEVGGVSTRVLIKRANVVEALRVPVCDGWQVVVDWDKIRTDEKQSELIDRYTDHSLGELTTLTMHEAQALSAYFPGSTVRPIVRSTSAASAEAGPPVSASLAPADEGTAADDRVVLVERPAAAGALDLHWAGSATPGSSGPDAPRRSPGDRLPSETSPATGASELADLVAVWTGHDPSGPSR